MEHNSSFKIFDKCVSCYCFKRPYRCVYVYRKKIIIEKIIYVIIYLMSFIVIELLFNFIKSVLIKKILCKLKKDTMGKIINLSIQDFNEKNSSNYISLLTNHVKDIEQDYLESVMKMLSMIFNLAFSAIVLLTLNPVLGGVALSSTFLSLLIPSMLSNLSNMLRLKNSEKQEELVGFTKDIFNGFELIKGYHVEKQILEEYQIRNCLVEKTKYRLNLLLSSFESMSMLLGYIVYFSVVLTGLFLSANSEITIGVLVASVQLSNNLVMPIMIGLQTFMKIKSMNGVVKKFYIRDSQKPSKSLQKKPNIQDGIVLKDISFVYKSEQKNIALKKINFKFETGKKYVIVGRSGSGKSTLLKLVARFFDGYEGKIYMDDTNIMDIETEDFYKIVSFVNQNTFMFDGTIEENIRFFQNIEVADTELAIKKAGLSTFLEGKSGGINEKIGEDGNKISGGEKQRIAIARAFARKSQVILLDEATSNLDNKLSFEIERDVLNSDCMVISVTHKLVKEVLEKYDCIIAMHEGEIVEYGSFETLMQKKGMLYSLYYLNNIKD